MKKILCFLVFFIVGCSSEKNCVENQSVGFTKEPLALTLKLEKVAYNPTDSIKANITLTNQENTNVVVNSRMALNFSGAIPQDRDLELIIVQPSGDAVPFNVKLVVALLADEYFVVLKPGDLIQTSYNLKEYYQLDETGDYSVTAVYENQFDPTKGLCAWKGKLVSNKSSFSLMP